MIAKCIKDTYTWNNEQHRFCDVKVGNVCIFEKHENTYWFKGVLNDSDRTDTDLVARGLAAELFFEMFKIV